jgi:hypothetical protein
MRCELKREMQRPSGVSRETIPIGRATAATKWLLFMDFMGQVELMKKG